MFRYGDFKSHSGLMLPFKIELDALTPEDWNCLALLIAEKFSFGAVEGVPTGGLKLADALRPFAQADRQTLLIVDDVLTTGESMEQFRAGRSALGVAIFARCPRIPTWIWPMFRLSPLWN